MCISTSNLDQLHALLNVFIGKAKESFDSVGAELKLFPYLAFLSSLLPNKENFCCLDDGHQDI